MTIAEKILASHAGRSKVEPGDVVTCDVDVAMATDGTAPLSIRVLEEMGADRVWDPDRVVLVNDHFQPAKDIRSAELARVMREFAREQEITHFFEVGRSGICHSLLPQEGLALPGELIVGADSHTVTYGGYGAFATGVGSTDLAAAWALGQIWLKVPPTIRVSFTGGLQPAVEPKDMILRLMGELGSSGALYKVLEYDGEAVRNMDMSGRHTLANMAVEAGAKAGLVNPDATTLEYVEDRAVRPFEALQSDPDAEYERHIEIDVDELAPQVAVPSLPENTVDVGEVVETELDQVMIGSCTNGSIEDLRRAHRYIEGREIHPDVRMVVIPGTREVVRQAEKEGLVEDFLAAGAIVSTPTCGPCIGGHMGVLASEEVALCTFNRNFRGRMGDPSSQVYLGSPSTAAASAVAGRIVDPRSVETSTPPTEEEQ